MKPNPAIWSAAQKGAGGADALAEKLRIARRTLFKWKAEGVPAERWLDVSRVTGIAPADLRPDLAAAFQGDVEAETTANHETAREAAR